jgi:hypothetical protein
VRAALVGALALVGCTSGDATAVDEPAEPDVIDDAAPEEELPQADEQSPEAPTDAELVAAEYQDFLQALSVALEAGDPDLEQLTSQATGDGLVSAQALVVSLTDQGRIARGELVPSFESVDVEGDAATIEDCYRLDLIEYDAETDEQLADRGGARFAASVELEREPDWVVTDFAEGDVCAPAEIAETVTDDYLAFWDAVWDAADPPDPDHPGLAATAAGDHLSGLQAQLTQLQEDGHVRRGRGTEHPVVVFVTAADTQALVSDCVEENPETGVYDATTGELVEGGTDPGQRTLLESRLELIDGTWRVTSVRVEEENSSCEPAAS